MPHVHGLAVLVLIGMAICGKGVGLPSAPAPREAVGPETAVRKAAESAEVHGVGVSHPAVYNFAHQDVKDWPKLVESLRAGKGPVTRVREILSEDARKLIAEEGIVEAFSAPLSDSNAQFKANQMKGYVSWGFNELLDWRDFYTPEAFKGVTLSEELKELVALGEKRTARQTALMNWGLLNAAFPASVPEVPPRFRTIRVEVCAGKDVILVLSCSAACHWEVDVQRGGKVTGVILCGTGAQEVKLFGNPVKVPAVYRAAHHPDGTRRMKPGDEWFDGRELRGRPDKKFEVREKFEAGMKKLLEKDFASFERELAPKKEPYIIQPGAK